MCSLLLTVRCKCVMNSHVDQNIYPLPRFAGSDSTASTMQSFCHHVLREPSIHARLREEIDAAVAAGSLGQFPQWNEVQALPYFQACLKEAMRVRPAVGLNITRQVPPQGAEIGGKKFPGGTRVAVNGWVLHRNEEVFGAEPKVFRPERWLEGDAKNMERYMFQFGGGSHLCKSERSRIMECIADMIYCRYRQKSCFARDEQDLAITLQRL